MDTSIPKDKNYPPDSVQCDPCGGHGCEVCLGRGWLVPQNHPAGRHCMNGACDVPLSPAHLAVYCSNQCALDDADG
ncbi:MAG: hypothetical protein UY97_C0005G0020 [Parcubacteria group bacterium GW2011_GWB1_57_6]|nr:MAG: hypothetical protein UY93_C0002G0275 [Parcubacteria group bacterium GW2011_GWA1_56_13]KKW46475.1 MAG: hypothetical protein UY97_C0005G0020 [Parcubacteria group bacterium GW2011_GWB1_57_6]